MLISTNDHTITKSITLDNKIKHKINYILKQNDEAQNNKSDNNKVFFVISVQKHPQLQFRPGDIDGSHTAHILVVGKLLLKIRELSYFPYL
jgi:hypothetical protein